MWLKELSESVNTLKDPFIKFLIRVALLLIILGLAFVIFLGCYSLLKGKHLKVASKDYGIDSPESSEKSKLPIDTSQSKKTSKDNIPAKKALQSSQLIVEHHKSKSNSRIDTIIKGKNVNAGSNSGTVGDNGHVVNGDNFGINGDVNINQEKQLNEIDKRNLMHLIDSLKKANDSNSNCFSMNLTSNTNGVKVASQIEKFLKERGYTMEGGGYNTVFYTTPLMGVHVDLAKNQNCISITLGTL